MGKSPMPRIADQAVSVAKPLDPKLGAQHPLRRGLIRAGEFLLFFRTGG
jgi:hypothetical protein